MSKSVNKVILLGHVGKDPEIRTAGSGTVIANLSIALSDRMKNEQGEWVDKTEWVNLIAFKRTAEIIRDYVRKGSKIYVEGKLQTSSWDDKQSGQKRYKTEVVVFDISLLDGKGEGQQGHQATHSNQQQSQEISDDDIPF